MDGMTPRRRNTVYIILLASLAFRLAFLAGNVVDLTRGPLYDDSFYCFSIARNLAEGHGSTFDQQHATNGYQPLWVALLVPLYWVSGQNDTLPIQLALVLSAIFNVGAGWILFRLVYRFIGWLPGVFALVLWGFGPAIVRQSINGLETSLAILLLAVALQYYLTVFRPTVRPTRRQGLVLGALLGLAMLARVDAVLFAIAVAIDTLWGRRAAGLRPLGLCLVSGFLVLAPWLVTSFVLVGSVVPESGRATRFLSQAYAPHDIASHPEAQGIVGQKTAVFLDNVGRSFMLLGTSPGVHGVTRLVEKVSMHLGIARAPMLYAIAAFLAIVVLLLVYLSNQHRRDRQHPLPSLNFLFGYSVLLMAAYSLVVFGQIFYSRYYYPIFFFSIFLAAIAFDVFLKVVVASPGRSRTMLAAGIVLLYLVTLPWMSVNRVRHDEYQFINVVRWIHENTDAQDRIGVFNSGAIGYFAHRHVVNLDGKVNPVALEALERGDLRQYLAAEDIDYVIDHGWILDHFLDPPHTQEPVRFIPVADASGLGVKGWRAYRVGRVAETALAPDDENVQVAR
jgi:hypothetical protein